MKDAQRPDEVWLLNLGYVTEHSEQNLILYGYLSAPDVVNVELLIDVNKFVMKYAVVLGKKGYRWYRFQTWLEGKRGLLGKLALLLFLRRMGSYDPADRIRMCIRDYAGPSWKTSTEVLSVEQYNERVGSSRGEGWVFKEGLDEGGRAPEQSRSLPAPTDGQRKDV